MSKIWRVLTRKKVIDPVAVEDTRLSRVLNTFDLTALGVGSTLGVGVYVLAGKVAKDVAGPSVVLSFLIAAIASVFAGLCYAEFGARAPRAGSAYVYSYVCVGEFVAFVIGWNLILEYVIGSASVARGLSLYLDTLLNNTIENTFKEIAPINVSFMSEYFDFLAFGISILLAIALAFGLKESSLANNIFTVLNIGVVLFVIFAGSIKADPKNWHFQPDNTTNATIVGEGGFFPFGIEGTIKGAATCFYGFVGFDCIATTGEEVKNPRKAIPISIILSLGIIFLSYFGISTVLTLMVPYYLQNPDAPIPDAFDQIGWNWAKWIVAIGGICGLFASLFGAMFPLPRIIYAMASDGLVFRFLGTVSSRFQAPVIGTMLAGLLTGLMAALFELSQLVNMMSIGTLMAYTVVAASVLLLRYTMEDHRYIPIRVNSDSDDNEPYTDNINSFTEATIDDNGLLSYERSSSSVVGQIFNCGRYTEPTKRSQAIVTADVLLYCVTCVCIGLSAIYLAGPISEGEVWAIVLAACTIFIAFLLIMSIATQPVSTRELTFKVPLVPLIPALSILANIYLMLMLDSMTWIRFAVWMAVGLPTYYFSVKPIDEHKLNDKLNESNNIGNKNQNGKINYYDNIAFVEDNSTNKEIQLKKKQAPPPPQSNEDKTEVIEIQQELEKLDEMLDEVANNFETIRKSSAGSVSVSMSREENVVADVHCDNVNTPAIPSSPVESSTPPLERPITLLIDKNLNDEKEIANVQTNSAIPRPTSLPLDQNEPEESSPAEKSKRLNRAGSIDSPAPPDTPVSIKSVAEESEYETPESSPPTPPPSANASPLPTPKIDDQAPVAPAPPPLPPVENRLLDESETKKPSSPLMRVTSSAIKSVTLKSMKKRKQEEEEKQEQEKEKQFEPDDTNLKLGSDKAKVFKEELNSKLSNFSGIPTYVAPIRTKNRAPPPPPPQPQERKKNENVIEESINKDEAKEKLGLYINTRISSMGSDDQRISNRSSLQQISGNSSPRSLTPAPSPIAGEILRDGEIDEPIVELVDDAYVAHQNRMKNVFRSMKNVDVAKEPPLTPSRNVKSLEHKLDDKAKHRQAMSDVFQTIQLRRKESNLQQSKV